MAEPAFLLQLLGRLHGCFVNRRQYIHLDASSRARLDTVAEIVNSCAGGANRSRIMHVANINSVVATEMLEKL
jgi:predicted transcriptional regulator